jgi:hypothetical protein
VRLVDDQAQPSGDQHDGESAGSEIASIAHNELRPIFIVFSQNPRVQIAYTPS